MKFSDFIVRCFPPTEAEIAVYRGRSQPTGPILLTNDNARVDTDWVTATGTGVYSGKLFFA